MSRKVSPPRLPIHKSGYADLVSGLTGLLEEARRAAARSVNTVLTATYWEVGRRIVEFEQGGANRAAYGETLLRRLSQDLSVRFGRGFSRENLRLMRLFYLHYRERISQTVSRKLPAVPLHVKSQTPSGLSPIHAAGSERTWIFETLPMCFPLPWSHYVRLLALDDPHKRDFYEEEARRTGWSVRQLDRQINSMLYERLALSRKKGQLLQKAEQGASPASPEEEIRDPYILEFLGLPEPYSEKDLENALLQHLADFLLELGYGFTFVARQKRLQVGSLSITVIKI